MGQEGMEAGNRQPFGRGTDKAASGAEKAVAKSKTEGKVNDAARGVASKVAGDVARKKSKLNGNAPWWGGAKSEGNGK